MDFTKIWPALEQMWRDGVIEGNESILLDERYLGENGQTVLVAVYFREFELYVN